jgi:hypothetical protein
LARAWRGPGNHLTGTVLGLAGQHLTGASSPSDLVVGRPISVPASQAVIVPFAWIDDEQDRPSVQHRAVRSDQTCIAEQMQLPRGCRPAQADLGRQSRWPPWAHCQCSHDSAPRRICEEFDS